MNIPDLIIYDKERVSLKDVLLEDAARQELVQLIREHAFAEELQQYGLPVNNKILLQGSSGCGKTMTAKAIAQELGRNILILNLSNVICSRIGETSQNIKQVFDKAAREQTVLFLDEFDQVGKARGNDDKDVGEMRRLVNTLLQLIDYYPEKSLLICATNHAELLDPALLRRFQLRIKYSMPSAAALDEYYDRLLARFPEPLRDVARKYDISFAEARDHTFTHVKAKLLLELEAQRATADL